MAFGKGSGPTAPPKSQPPFGLNPDPNPNSNPNPNPNPSTSLPSPSFPGSTESSGWSDGQKLSYRDLDAHTLHHSDADEDDENVKQLDECSSLYLLMQDCVVRSNRNWKECQTEIQALKECSEKRNKKKGK